MCLRRAGQRRTISAIFWRHQNGAKWRSIPAELGPWWLAAQLFLRWAEQGTWERLVENLWVRLKEGRAVATRYEKTARSFLGIPCLAATAD